MNGRAIISTVFLLLLTSASAGVAQETPRDRLQAGIYAEEVQGNLDEALAIYRSILRDYPENRTVGAKAQLHIGLCLEILGLNEAREAYKRVVEEYGEQRDEVALARERLASLMEEQAELRRQPRFRKVQIASKPQNGVLSPDGGRLAFVSEGSLWVVPLQGEVAPGIAGAPTRIGPTEGLAGALSPLSLSWSADGEWIAVNSAGAHSEAYVFPVEGGDPWVVPIPNRGRHAWSYRVALSPGGGTLAFSALGEGQVEESSDSPEKRLIFTVPVDGGNPQQLSETWGRQPAFSPDGETIAYVTDRMPADDVWDSDLWLVPASGGPAVKVLTTETGRLRGPIWSPDGRYIAAHYEPGTNNFSQELWVIPVASHQTNRAVTKIKLPRNSMNMLAGWTPENQIGVFMQAPSTPAATFTVPALGGKAAQATADVELGTLEWSADGQRILGSWSSPGDSILTIASVPAGGGEVSTLPLPWGQEVSMGVGLDVSPDGRRVVFMGLAGGLGRSRPGPEHCGIWTVSMDGQDPTPLTGGSRFDAYPAWSPDGRWIAFLRLLEEDPDHANIHLIPSEGGEIRQLTSDADAVTVGGIAFSPGGDRIAYFSDGAIKAVPVGGGPPGDLLEVEGLGYFPDLSWSPDGGKIVYTPGAGGRIMVGSLDTGRSVPLATGLSPDPRFSSVAWSPDGQRIAFGASWPRENEFWLISDFLPEGR